MKKQQLIVAGSGVVLFCLIYFFGRTVPKKDPNAPAATAQTSGAAAQSIDLKSILEASKKQLSAAQQAYVSQLESAVVRGNVKEQQIKVYRQLAGFWRDSAHLLLPYAYYTAEASKLENSEKSLTFAARLFLDRLMMSGDPAMQNWLANNAKVLLENALKINPANDSSSIGLGACYLFGNISSNPMEGITLIKKVVDRNPENIYGQMMLALGGKKSGQYDKAIERFLLVVKKEPDNIEAIFHIAECYDLKGDKSNAIVYYEKARELVKIPQAKEELSNRIMELKK